MDQPVIILLELKTLLSDGSEAVFGPVDYETFRCKMQSGNLEGNIYRNIKQLLENDDEQKEYQR